MSQAPESAYLSIGDYALIGNGLTAALVGGNGSVDWCCWPRFDSPAVLCRLLDGGSGGWFQIVPTEPAISSRKYLLGTNILTTTFSTASGKVRLTDFMPAPQSDHSTTRHCILRRIEGLAGEVELQVSFRPTFQYGTALTHLTPIQCGVIARAGTECLTLSSPIDLEREPNGTANGRLTTMAGNRSWVALTYSDEAEAKPQEQSDFDPDAELDRTLEYWKRWSAACTYSGPYRDLVLRSALVLKLLTYEPTGALIAAPTTSLPEELGGVRNWDYRYTWLRDSGLILDALQQIGYHDESIQFFRWLEQLCLTCHGEPRIMYTIDGGSPPPERTLEHLDGYRGSRPVRIGNAAADQRQLDVYGSILDVVYLCLKRMPRPINSELWEVLRPLADAAAERWREADRGIWEVRGEPRHFVHSKLMCWVAVDRAVQLAERAGLPGNVARWRQARDEIRAEILNRGFNKAIGAFTQAFDSTALDASVLTIPLVEFLPATDPRVLSTMDCIREKLALSGLIRRYVTEDGLPAGEAPFALCSFWMVSNLALAGRTDEARALFNHVCSFANDLGLLAEEIDPHSGELLGNFPQGFTHLGLIRAVLDIAHAESRTSEESGRQQIPAP